MIVARDGWLEPQVGQKVYLVKKDGEPVAVTLRYTSVVRAMGIGVIDDFIELSWMD